MNTKTSEEKEHSEFGGSGAERFINCPASIKLARGIPNKENEASRKGTAAHACVEFFIRNHKKLKTPSSRKKLLAVASSKFTKFDDGEKIFWTEDMIANALDVLSWVKDQIGPNSKVFVEAHLDSSAFTTEGQFSTLDIAIANFNARELIIADYKDGKHTVEVKNNSQLIYYALAMLIKLKGFKKFDRIRCVIIQPNAHHKKGTYRDWYLTVDEAIAWGKKCRKAVKVALGPKPTFKANDKWCFFCRAKKKCPIMKKKIAAKEFAD